MLVGIIAGANLRLLVVVVTVGWKKLRGARNKVCDILEKNWFEPSVKAEW